MLSNVFVYLIILLAAIERAKPQITIDQDSCAPHMQTMQAALNEMVEMSSVAYDRTEELWNLQASIDELRVVLNTFDSYFASNNDQQTEISARDILCRFFSNKYL
jgi:hypothetical protein